MVPRMTAAIVVTVVLIVAAAVSRDTELVPRGHDSAWRCRSSLIGACWFTWAMGYNWSLAVAIGMIALAGLDAETGLVMLLYLDNSLRTLCEGGPYEVGCAICGQAVHDGAVKRIRPKAMTVAAAFIGLVPLLWAHGSGADVMRRLARALIGGLAVSFVMELLVYPIIFYLYKRVGLPTMSIARCTMTTGAQPVLPGGGV